MQRPLTSMLPRCLGFMLVAVAVVACGSSSSSGDPAASSTPPADGGTPTTCAAVAARLCRASVTCGGGTGSAKITLSAGSNSIAYASEAYCTMIFTQQCGPTAPANDVPRVADPAACGSNLSVATCSGSALLLPPSCGGS